MLQQKGQANPQEQRQYAGQQRQFFLLGLGRHRRRLRLIQHRGIAHGQVAGLGGLLQAVEEHLEEVAVGLHLAAQLAQPGVLAADVMRLVLGLLEALGQRGLGGPGRFQLILETGNRYRDLPLQGAAHRFQPALGGAPFRVLLAVLRGYPLDLGGRFVLLGLKALHAGILINARQRGHIIRVVSLQTRDLTIERLQFQGFLVRVVELGLTVAQLLGIQRQHTGGLVLAALPQIHQPLGLHVLGQALLRIQQVGPQFFNPVGQPARTLLCSLDAGIALRGDVRLGNAVGHQHGPLGIGILEGNLDDVGVTDRRHRQALQQLVGQLVHRIHRQRIILAVGLRPQILEPVRPIQVAKPFLPEGKLGFLAGILFGRFA